MGTTPETVVPATPPQVDPATVEGIRQATLREVFGDKFQGDVGKAKEGYWNLVQYATQNAELAAQNGAPAQPPSDPFARIEAASLVPQNDLREAISSVLKQEFGPIASALAARDEMVRRYPDFNTNEAQVLAHLESNPELKQRTQALTSRGFALDAHELAYASWQRATPKPSIPTPQPGAGLPGAPASAPGRAAPGPTDTGAERLVAAVNEALRSGDERAVWRETYKDVKYQFPPEYNPGN